MDKAKVQPFFDEAPASQVEMLRAIQEQHNTHITAVILLPEGMQKVVIKPWRKKKGGTP